MHSKRTYLDHNASSALRPQARTEMMAALDETGNPSSVHAEGRAVRARMERARANVAALVGGEAKNVIFASGATEALALALRRGWRTDPAQAPLGLLAVSATEHVAVHNSHDFGESVVSVAVTPDGQMDFAALEKILQDALAKGIRPLVAVQAANNETGVLQPVKAIAAEVHAAGGLLVCDAVQAAGRVACAFTDLDADMIVLASHKIGGPKGAGALILRSSRLTLDQAILRGGGQERGFRAGTENSPAIAGFGAAAAVLRDQATEEARKAAEYRDALEKKLRALSNEIVIFGAASPRLPNTSAFAVPGASAETLMIALDLAGVAISSGSACSSGKIRGSHVLEALGVSPELAKGALRVSFGWNSTQADGDAFFEALSAVLARIKQRTS